MWLGLFRCINGLGGLTGYLLAGWLRERSGGDVASTFVPAAVLTAGLLVLFVAGFRQPRREIQADSESPRNPMDK